MYGLYGVYDPYDLYDLYDLYELYDLYDLCFPVGAVQSAWLSNSVWGWICTFYIQILHNKSQRQLKI